MITSDKENPLNDANDLPDLYQNYNSKKMLWLNQSILESAFDNN